MDNRKKIILISFSIHLFISVCFLVGGIWFFMKKDKFCYIDVQIMFSIPNYIIYNGIIDVTRISVFLMLILIKDTHGEIFMRILVIYFVFYCAWILPGVILIYKSYKQCIPREKSPEMLIFLYMMTLYNVFSVLANTIFINVYNSHVEDVIAQP